MTKTLTKRVTGVNLNGLTALLAELGISQYAPMAFPGHSEAKTSKVYPAESSAEN